MTYEEHDLIAKQQIRATVLAGLAANPAIYTRFFNEEEVRDEDRMIDYTGYLEELSEMILA